MMTNRKTRKAQLGGVALLTTIAVAGALVQGSAAQSAVQGAQTSGWSHSARAAGPIQSLNNSGVQGKAIVRVKGRRISVRINARGLARNLPHAQHIHAGGMARHKCPTVKDDTNGDFRLTTSEGQPAYGNIKVSLTTRGDTSPASALAVNRFSQAPKGVERYDRRTRVSASTAKAIRRGNAVVVIHGVDYNNNGSYDFGSAGASDIDPSLPAEATDPVACVVLKRH